MPEIPDCLNRRYQALDELIQELTVLSSKGSHDEGLSDTSSNDPGIKLMCDFWNILKEDPDCNLSQAVKQRMGIHATSSTVFQQNVTCYMAGKSSNEKKREALNKIKSLSKSSQQKCCSSIAKSRATEAKDVMPLSKVLCNLQEAASFEKKCNARINELMKQQQQLQDQIQRLEEREKQGVQLLQEADCMWSCMEDAYKKRVSESVQRQKELMKQLKEVETSNAKWRKNKKDLDSQMNTIMKCHREITESIGQKTNDMKCMDAEIADFKKRIETNKGITEGAKKSVSKKKQASEDKIANITLEVSKLTKVLSEVNKQKVNKEQEGQLYVKEAREDLQKMCKVLLQKKLENEDLNAEKDALIEEINILKESCNECQEKCKNKQSTFNEDINKINQEIGNYQVKCLRCHQCTDTIDVRKLCTDCPRCIEEIDCLTEGDHCEKDTAMDCVCMSVKEKFLDNVFENMYTVLEKQSRTGQGKAVAEAVLSGLKYSRNGKLNTETRQILQDFVLDTIKKNLNLTIIGGAVKTRCELDPETYKQLMLCLKQVKAVKPPKADKGTMAKKDSCRRWGGTSECNCPGGAKSCPCSKRAPPPPVDISSCPPVPEKDKDKDEDETTAKVCPHKQSTSCGPDCAMHAVPSAVGKDVAAWRPDPCSGPACPFSKNMRAAQCVLGPESLSSLPKTFMASTPFIPDMVPNKITCKCETSPTKSCLCKRDAKQLKAGLATYCDSGTCTALWDQPNHDHNSYALVEKNADHEIKLLPNVSTEAISEIQETKTVDENSQYKGLTQKRISFEQNDIIKNKPDIDSKHAHLNGPVIFMYTQSGSLVMELDEKVIDLINKKTIEDPNLVVKLKKTNSGQFFVDFNSAHNVENDIQRMMVKKTSSGSLFLEVKRDFVNILSSKLNVLSNEEKGHVIDKILDIKPKDENQPLQYQVPIEYEKNKLESIQNENKIVIHLKNKYEENSTITVKIKNEKGMIKVIEAPITKTLSGNIAVELSLCDEIKMKYKERAAVVTISDSDDIILDTSENNVYPNAIVRKTESGGFLLVLTDPVLQSMETGKLPMTSENKYYKFTIEGTTNDITDPLAVLKLTPSRNYVFIPDKEFENVYKQTIQDLLDDSTEYLVNITRTDSDTYTIRFDESDDENEPNAFIVKHESGVKVIKRNKSWTSTEREQRRTSIDVNSKMRELLDKLPRQSIRSNSSVPRASMCERKSSSDSNLYEKVKLFYPDHKDLLADPSAILKKTDSGQYAVILDKESKNNFIKNLRSYLKNNFQGLVPVKKTDTGEITISLKGDMKDKCHYGSLKITPSGNVYVIVDEYLVKGMIKEPPKNNTNCTDATSKHKIGNIKFPVNKGVTTTCNALPGSTCDVSKCACSDIKFENESWVFKGPENDAKDTFLGSHICGIDWKNVKRNPDGSYKISHPNNCTDKFCTDTKTSSPNNSTEKAPPHIIIKPSECKPALPNNHHVNRQCFYVIEAVCPFAEDCQTISKLKVHKDVKNNSNWDSLKFLPPQLPPFLKDIKYK